MEQQWLTNQVEDNKSTCFYIVKPNKQLFQNKGDTNRRNLKKITIYVKIR